MSDEMNKTRRDFIKSASTTVAGAALASTMVARSSYAASSDTIRLGMIGCGGRCTGAAAQAMNTEGPTKLVAMCDAFGDKVEASHKRLKKQYKGKVDVPKDNMFTGFDGYKKVIDSDIDLVLIATPPHFRPMHVEYAIKQGKHVFAEKPVAVDAAGVRTMLAATAEAKKKNLALAIGLQRHHEAQYKQTIQRLQDGAIGDINFTRAYWNGGGVWVRPRQAGQTEMEYQMRNWYYFNWLCGDHIVEQHIHNLDVINWLKGGFPVKGQGMGGRQVRTGKDHGEIYDHFAVEFTYEDGSTLLSECRHIKGCFNSVSEHAHGSKGSANIGRATIYNTMNASKDIKWKFEGRRQGGHQQEHHDLFAEIRKGNIPNEGEYGAKSTMTSIFGRMLTYSGKEMSWDQAINSNKSLMPEAYRWDAKPPTVPDADGNYPIPMPGKTKVI